jgi:hypothetical protein
VSGKPGSEYDFSPQEQRADASFGATPAREHDALHAEPARYGSRFDHPDWPLR